jgi:O-6-methylguanine DNA methyltransferase
MRASPIATLLGTFTAWWSDHGLARLDFPARKRGPWKAGNAAGPRRRLQHRWHRLATAALRSALTGRNPGALPPLDLSAGTPFQRSVWRELRRIRPGDTRSYLQLARALGRPRAARAVGGACGANPIPVLIPCHRVLASGGGLGGFSAGLPWKRRLLALEAGPGKPKSEARSLRAGSVTNAGGEPQSLRRSGRCPRSPNRTTKSPP